jgi:hypothetical protein
MQQKKNKEVAMKTLFKLGLILGMAFVLLMPVYSRGQTELIIETTAGDRIGGAILKAFSFTPDGKAHALVEAPFTFKLVTPDIWIDTPVNCTIVNPLYVTVAKNSNFSFKVNTGDGALSNPVNPDLCGSPPSPCASFTPATGIFSWDTNGILEGPHLVTFGTDAGDKPQILVTINIVPPETVNKPTLSGPPSGTAGQSVGPFAASATSSAPGDTFTYNFIWGDVSPPPTPSFGTSPQSHTFASVGTYYVKVQAKCSHGTIVESDPLQVSISTIVQYTLTIEIPHTGGGTVKVDGTDYSTPRSFDSGTSVTLVATFASGHKFDSWSQGVTGLSTNSTYTFTISSNRMIAANFSDVGSVPPPGGAGSKSNPFKLNTPYSKVSSGYTYGSTPSYQLGAGAKVYFEIDPVSLKTSASAFQMTIKGMNCVSLGISRAYYDKNSQTYSDDVFIGYGGIIDTVRTNVAHPFSSTKFLYVLENTGVSWTIELYVQVF